MLLNLKYAIPRKVVTSLAEFIYKPTTYRIPRKESKDHASGMIDRF
jgi:hypothetical protein